MKDNTGNNGINSSSLKNIMLNEKERLFTERKIIRKEKHSQWYRFYKCLKLSIIQKEFRSYKREEALKIDQYSKNAAQYVLEQFEISPLIFDFSKKSSEKLAPLKNVVRFNYNLPLFFSYLDQISLSVTKNAPYQASICDIAKKESNMIKPINTILYLGSERFDCEVTDYSFRDHHKSPSIAYLLGIDAETLIRPLVDFKQEEFVFSKINSEEHVLSSFASLAVSTIELFGGFLPFSHSVKRSVEPFLEMHHHSSSSQTMDEVFSRNEIQKANSNQFYEEANELLSGFNNAIDEFANRIFPLIVQENYFNKSMFEQELNFSIFPVAQQVSNDKNQAIPSFSFLDNRLDTSLVSLISHTFKVNETVQNIAFIATDLSEKLLMRTLMESDKIGINEGSKPKKPK